MVSDEAGLVLPEGDVLLSLSCFNAHRSAVLAHTGRKGVILAPDEFAESIADVADQLDLVAIRFPSFADGRGYSTAYLLRTRYGFRGELRAIGDIFKDTLFYQQRVGFDAFVLASDEAALAALPGLSTFSEVYHGSADNEKPLFLRRSL
ncbi:MAG: DUF934 domain-containing protein [Paraperlucidibaca sp.]